MTTPPFKIIIDQIVKPKNTIILYKITHKEDSPSTDASIVLQDSMQYKIMTTIKIEKNEESEKVVTLPQEHE